MKKITRIVAEDNTLFNQTGIKKSKAVKRAIESEIPATDKPEKKRDYKLERQDAQIVLFNEMVSYRVQRNAGTIPQLVQIAQCLILCGLPYRQTDETKIVRIARLGPDDLVRVTFNALASDIDGKSIPMPYGTDRTPLHFAIDQAIKQKSPFVSLRNPTTYLEAIGLQPGGPNYERMRDALRRLSGLSIMVERFTSDQQGGYDEAREQLPIIEGSNIPSRLDSTRATLGEPYGLRLSKAFFEEVSEHHVPFPWEILRSTAQKPMMQDYILFLHRRSFAAKSVSCIPWRALRMQLGGEDTNIHRMRPDFAKAIKLLKTAWPELNAEAMTRGLVIGPPRGGKHLFPVYDKALEG
jgi:Plasmid encoded RepA protein